MHSANDFEMSDIAGIWHKCNISQTEKLKIWKCQFSDKIRLQTLMSVIYLDNTNEH